MSLDKYVTQTFSVECKGRDINGNDFFSDGIRVDVTISKSPGSSTISSNVTCPYNTGAHGQRCKASHPKIEKILFEKGMDPAWNEDIICPYSFDIPYALEKKSRSF